MSSPTSALAGRRSGPKAAKSQRQEGPSVDEKDAGTLALALAHAQDLRDLALDLRRALARAIEPSGSSDMSNGTSRAQGALDKARGQLQRRSGQIADHSMVIRRALGNPQVDLSIGDAAHHLLNAFDDAEADWPKKDDPLPDQVVASKATIERLEYAVREANRALIPSRLADIVANSQVGDAVDFDERFERVTLDADERTRLLADMKPFEGRLSGFIDVQNRKVYRGARSPWLRVLSCSLPLFLVVALGALLPLVASLDDWGLGPRADWPLTDGKALMGAYVFVVAGAVLHLVVEHAKWSDLDDLTHTFVLGRSLMWLHLRWASVAVRATLPFLAVIVLRYAGVGDADGDYVTYLFAGYSIDSLSGLLRTRITTAAEGVAGPLKAKLTG